jgi:hypothetical protein
MAVLAAGFARLRPPAQSLARVILQPLERRQLTQLLLLLHELSYALHVLSHVSPELLQPASGPL